MNVRYFMPTRVFIGPGCVKANAPRFSSLGSSALVMTGRSSARLNGSAGDVRAALESLGIRYRFYEEIEPNPTIADCRKAAGVAREFEADFVIGIGGGSPLDAAKATALLARNDLVDSAIFANSYPKPALPIVAVPTTAGTGSEVTQFSILTNDSITSKSSIAWDGIFPSIALLDAAYTESLPRAVTVNTALDALSHAIEGYLANKSDPMSRTLALESMGVICRSLRRLEGASIAREVREDLLFASNMAGMVIAQTFTTAVHGMGYSLTYFRHIDHGRANGLLLGAYLAFIARDFPKPVAEVLSACGAPSLAALRDLLDGVLGERESIGEDEIARFSSLAIKTGHIANTMKTPTEGDLAAIYRESFR